MAWGPIALIVAIMAFLTANLTWGRAFPWNKPKKGKEPSISTEDGQVLTDLEFATFRNGSCPDCGCVLEEGPVGGLSVNYRCSNLDYCGSKFNYMGPFGVERISPRSPHRANIGHEDGPFR